ncbi:hypothetical protein [Evansella cellulosilytica]|uniref:Uncharacterized protein n=1 Tax=Evansella cellulosilytica (strain ATCC 21833 / DSM 2522 / FERM P-1141 / JCM 9156 / N-4) TaxID=649639 RepID=E6TZS7_EVAC2|nr:hypothetical protein [Evansella cellulosilytica]ADU31383.1 hypothetical protein Bcell_3140 [Evansella cellulosilytica DSM 2522]
MTTFFLLASFIYAIARKKITLTPVKKEVPPLSKSTRAIYDYITGKGYYVSCSLKYGLLTIPLCLRPFKIALLKRSTFSKIKKWYLSLLGWKVFVVAFEDYEKDEELKRLLQIVERRKSFFKSDHYKQTP